MKNDLHREYHNKGTKKVDRFIHALEGVSANKETGTFDSTAATEFLVSGLSQGDLIPEKLQIILDESDADQQAGLSRAIMDGINSYKFKHGEAPSMDVVESAIALGYSTTDHAQSKFGLKSMATMDNIATTNASAATGLQPNRAAVSIVHTITMAIPFAHYLPADIGSNEARLAVLTHQAGSDYGSYAVGGLMDGVASGDAYISSSRTHATTNLAGAHTGQLTSVQTTPDTCAAVGGNVVAVNLLRGRSNVFVNGELVATEVSNTGTGASTVSGAVTILGTTYQIGGTINTDTGVIALTSTPALANAVPVIVEGFIDYERMPALTPSIVSSVEVFNLYAKPWRVTTTQTIDSRTQMTNELGIDPYSEGIRAVQVQFSNERLYEVLRKAMRLAANNTATFDFKWATQGTYKKRADIWQDFNSIIGAVSQKMANDTLGFGVNYAFVGQHVASQLLSLPSTLFVQSGMTERAGSYFLGTLFGRYKMYYSPKVLTDSVASSQILCIGRANDVSRNPFVLGDAVAPMVVPLATNADLKQGAGFYARNFTDVNRYAPSTKACALITVINMGL